MTAKWQRWKGIMKAYPFEEKRLAKWQPPYIVQPKYDGVRCRAVPLENGDFLLLSSEENVIFSVPHINQACKIQLPHKEFDGELYCHGYSFEQIVSITSRTTNVHPDFESIQYHIFDVIDEGSQAERLRSLWTVKMDEPLWRTTFSVAESLDDVMKVYDNFIKLGFEGIIVRHADAPYERKRSTWVMKFKPKKEDEYVILGSEEEVSADGTPKDSLGALVLRSGDGGVFRVGTGFDRRTREDLWRNREVLKGRIARVKYQHLTAGKGVPRFPVFVEVTSDS